MSRPNARSVKGFRDVFAADLLLKRRMIDAVRGVYERYGFVPLETPAVEFVDVLGKFLPESHTPSGGIFAFRNPDLDAKHDPKDPDYWLALRYDLTAPLARVASQYAEQQRPFRRYQLGSVFRIEKPAPGRFREFQQLDFDSIGVPTMAADAEACMVMCDALEAIGFKRGEYVIRVNDRKVMRGFLESCGLADDINDESSKAAAVLRAIDKLDRLGLPAVRELLGKGRKDESGDFTPGAGLDDGQIARIDAYLTIAGASRAETCDRLADVVGAGAAGREGVEELRTIDHLLGELGYGDDRVAFDPTVIRGLSYYTGPVFEGVITREVKDEDGKPRQFGTVFGGGRYDSLVERFTGQKVPATGASIGVDRLLEAMKLIHAADRRNCTAEVLVTTMDATRTADYFRLARSLRDAGINAEVFLGGGRIGKQLQYADRMGMSFAVIAGSDEFARGAVQLKDLRLGKELSSSIADRDEWRKGQPAQVEIAATELVAEIKRRLGAR